MDTITKIHLKQCVNRVLNAPGNLTKGILEMTIVYDFSLPEEYLRDTTTELIKTLKIHSEIFRNVRMNTVKWVSDDQILTEITPIPNLLLGKYFEGYVQNPCEKSLDELTGILKIFHARSKLILILTSSGNRIVDEGSVKKNLTPFLKRKLISLSREDAVLGLEC